MQTQTKTASSTGLNIAPDKCTSITSGINQEASEYDYASLLGGAYIALEPAGDNIFLFGDNASLTGDYVYPPGDRYIGV